MKTKFLVLLLLVGTSLFAGPRVFVGIGVGGFGLHDRYLDSPVNQNREYNAETATLGKVPTPI